MANIKSAKKRIKVSARRSEENRGKKTELTTAIKKFKAMVNNEQLDEAKTFLTKVVSLIDSSNSHGRLHKKTASRKVARLAKMLDKAIKSKGKTVTVKKPAKKTATTTAKTETSTTVKKAPVKKTATTTAKKATSTTVKKAPAKKTATTTAKKATSTTVKKAPVKKITTKTEAK